MRSKPNWRVLELKILMSLLSTSVSKIERAAQEETMERRIKQVKIDFEGNIVD